MTARHSDFLIIGGGINGLLVARELAQSGASITLLERGDFGKEASWAGGGIISPLYPWRYPPAVTALARWAQDFYPQLSEQLQAETGIDPELTVSGLLMLDAADASQARGWAAENGAYMEEVKGPALYRQEPNLGEGYQTGLWMPHVASVRNPRLLKALVSALTATPGVTLCSDCQTVGFVPDGARIRSLQARWHDAPQEFSADRIVLCAGAWSTELLGSLGVAIDVEPVKGQMLLYRPETTLTRSILLTRGRYVIPRRDGLLLVGSTLEYCGFDKQPTATAGEQLQQSAWELLPGLRAREPVAQWAGLRPGTPAGIPYIGRCGEWENLFLNTGQFRNGLVLAPASARLLGDILLHRPPIVDPAPYGSDRAVSAGQPHSIPSFFKR